jgi:hypothetical protein
MTYEQAMQMLERDKSTIVRALSDLETVKALYSLGERDTAVNMLAVVKHRVKTELAESHR